MKQIEIERQREKKQAQRGAFAKELRESGLTYVEIGKRIGVTAKTASAVVQVAIYRELWHQQKFFSDLHCAIDVLELMYLNGEDIPLTLTSDDPV